VNVRSFLRLTLDRLNLVDMCCSGILKRLRTVKELVVHYHHSSHKTKVVAEVDAYLSNVVNHVRIGRILGSYK